MEHAENKFIKKNHNQCTCGGMGITYQTHTHPRVAVCGHNTSSIGLCNCCNRPSDCYSSVSLLTVYCLPCSSYLHCTGSVCSARTL